MKTQRSKKSSIHQEVLEDSNASPSRGKTVQASADDQPKASKNGASSMPNPIAILMGYAGEYRSGFFGSVVLAVLGVLCGVVPFFAAAAIFSNLLGNAVSFEVCLGLCGIAALGYVGKVVFANVSTAVAHHAAYGTMKHIREMLVDKLSRMPLGELMRTPSGQLTATITDKVESLESTLAHFIPEMTANLIIPIILIIYMFVLDWRMALAALAVIVLGIPFMGMMFKGSSMQAGAIKTKNHMNSVIVEYVNGIKEIKMFCQDATSYRKYFDAVMNNASYHYEWMRATELGMAGYMVIMPTTLLTVLPVGCLFLANGSLGVAEFCTLIIVSLSAVQPLMSVTTFMSNVASMGMPVAAIQEILNAPELVRPEAQPSDEIPVEGTAGINLKDVTFAYEGGTEVLHGINIDIPPGSTCALVGPSGGGKSTIARLIAGLWDASSGTVCIGGTPISQISLTKLSNLVAYVAQDSYLFDDTIRNNIRVGRMTASDEEVEWAARTAGCEPFILSLENGYDTVVGSGGGHLSGGERQRIAIARAMLRNAPIVVMDESTAYLDPDNENIVEQAISELTRGKTLVMIAHRLSTVINSDQIVVIDQGRVSASGTHEELLENSNLYKSMWEAHVAAKDSDTQC